MSSVRDQSESKPESSGDVDFGETLVEVDDPSLDEVSDGHQCACHHYD